MSRVPASGKCFPGSRVHEPTSPYSRVLTVRLRTVLFDNRSPNIYGDGGQTRDFTYVANVVDGVLRACEAPRASGEVINVATGGRISLNDLFREMKRITGASVEPTYLDPRTGDVRDSQADIRKAKDILGYQPTVTFEDGLERTIEWYRASRPVTIS